MSNLPNKELLENKANIACLCSSKLIRSCPCIDVLRRIDSTADVPYGCLSLVFATNTPEYLKLCAPVLILEDSSGCSWWTKNNPRLLSQILDLPDSSQQILGLVSSAKGNLTSVCKDTKLFETQKSRNIRAHIYRGSRYNRTSKNDSGQACRTEHSFVMFL